MKKYPYILFLLMVVFVGCKSNPEAYSNTYRKLKEKEESQFDANAKTAMDVPQSSNSNDTTTGYLSENFNLVLGEKINVSDFNIVARSFINRTNARGYFSQMEDNGYPAVLVQNEEMLFRIIIASFTSREDAENKLKEIKKIYPEAYILMKLHK